MNLRRVRRSLLLAAGLSAACTNSANQVAAAAENICRDAAAAALPARPVAEADVGKIRRATFRMTELPRPDGRTSIVLTDIVAQVDRGGEVSRETQHLAYVEDRECWDTRVRGGNGFFECYERDHGDGRYPTAIGDTHTRAVLSVLAYMATGGASDAISRDRSDRIRPASSDLFLKTSAPSLIDSWYFCQTCGAAGGDRPAAVSSMKRMTFGRSNDATYFLSAEGQVARLRDNETKAAFAICAVR